MRNRALPGIDEDALRTRAQAQFEKLKAITAAVRRAVPARRNCFGPPFRTRIDGPTHGKIHLYNDRPDPLYARLPFLKHRSSDEMTNWPVHAAWNGPIVMIGFGSIGRGTLPLILRHIKCSPKQITVIDPDGSKAQLVRGAWRLFSSRIPSPRKNYRSCSRRCSLTAGPGPAFVVNLSVDVDSLDIMRLARATNALYIDTVIEPWSGFYYNTKLSTSDRSNYALRENLLKLKHELGEGPTAVSCCGANPGMVSWFVKQALMDIAAATNVKAAEPKTREGWGQVDEAARRQGNHVAERDTQRAKSPKPFGTFINTWSVDGFISEGLQPPNSAGARMRRSCRPRQASQAWLRRRHHISRAPERIRGCAPGRRPRARYGFSSPTTRRSRLPTISQCATAGRWSTAPTCHYAYHPSNDAVLSWHEMLGAGQRQPNSHILEPEEIADGADELGVLLYGHKKNAIGMARSCRSTRPASWHPTTVPPACRSLLPY